MFDSNGRMSKKPIDGSQSHSASPHIKSSSYRTSLYGAEPLSVSPSSSRSSGSRSRRNKSNKIFSPPTASPGKSPSKSPVLPPDAVDLIVEDDEAAEEEQTWERRKGEPAVRGPALRKVYRRGFVAHDGEGRKADGEEQIDNLDVEFVSDKPREMPLNDGDEGALRLEGQEDTIKSAEGTIVRAVTPPLRSQAAPLNYDIHGENPWA